MIQQMFSPCQKYQLLKTTSVTRLLVQYRRSKSKSRCYRFQHHSQINLNKSVGSVLITLLLCVGVSELAYAVIHMLVLFSSTVNPFVYALVNKNFREKLRGMTCCNCTGSTRNRVRQQSLTPKTGTSAL